LLTIRVATHLDVRVVILCLWKSNCVLNRSPFDAVRSQQCKSSTDNIEPASGHSRAPDSNKQLGSSLELPGELASHFASRDVILTGHDLSVDHDIVSRSAGVADRIWSDHSSAVLLGTPS
jgi:hypothetical protein